MDLGSGSALETALRHRLLDARFKAIERQIGEHWRDDASLGSAFLRGVERLAFQVSGLQPLLQYALVHRDVRQQPLVADAIETGFDVGIEDPLGCIALGQHHVALTVGITDRAPRAKPIRMGIRQRFRHRLESQQVERLHGSIFHRRWS